MHEENTMVNAWQMFEARPGCSQYIVLSTVSGPGFVTGQYLTAREAGIWKKAVCPERQKKWW